MTTLRRFAVVSQRDRVAQLAARHKLPAMYSYKLNVDAGGLMAYDSYDLRRAATFVDRILKGAKPADLPVEQPRKFELTIPQTLLVQADQVIE